MNEKEFVTALSNICITAIEVDQYSELLSNKFVLGIHVGTHIMAETVYITDFKMLLPKDCIFRMDILSEFDAKAGYHTFVVNDITIIR